MPPKVNLTHPLPTHSFYTNRGTHKGLALLWHYYGIVIAQSQFTILLIMMTHFVSKLFYDEHHIGKRIIYKHIKRCRILNAKLYTLFSIYFLYYTLLFISSHIYHCCFHSQRI